MKERGCGDTSLRLGIATVLEGTRSYYPINYSSSQNQTAVDFSLTETVFRGPLIAQFLDSEGSW